MEHGFAPLDKKKELDVLFYYIQRPCIWFTKCVYAGEVQEGVENQVLRSNGAAVVAVVSTTTVTPAVVAVLLAVRPFNFHTHHCFVIYENVNN